MARGQAPGHGPKGQRSAPLLGRRRRHWAPTVPNGRALGPGPWPWPRRTRTFYAATALGRRPRRATARPGISPEQLSQRSACLAPRRASVNVSRSVAPFPSPTSLPQLSQTRTVLRAKAKPPFYRKIAADPSEIRTGILRSGLRLANAPRTEQREECALLQFKVDIPRSDDA
jgi:hypothetical protein